MTHPTKHPKTGIYQTRKVIPIKLRGAAKASFGVGHEFKTSLGTKDEREALRMHPGALADIEAKLATLRDIEAGMVKPLSNRQAQALAGRWYHAEAAKHEDDSGTPKQWQEASWVIGDQADAIGYAKDAGGEPGAIEYEITLSENDRQDALRALMDEGLPALPQSIDKVAHAIWAAKMALYPVLERRAVGDWSPDANLIRFPTLLPGAPNAMKSPVASLAKPGLSFDDLLNWWANDQGLKRSTKPIPRPLYDRIRTLERLATFLGHRDALRVTKADAVRWKGSMQERDLSVLTVRNDLSEMSALWKHAIAQGTLQGSGDCQIFCVRDGCPMTRTWVFDRIH